MRWLIGGIAVLAVVVVAYFGSAAASLNGLADAVRSGNGAAVIERTDVSSLKQSLADQIIAAYLERIGQTREIRPTEKILVRAVGQGVADVMIAKLLTPGHLTQMLKTGQVNAGPDVPPLAGLPKLADLDTGRLGEMLQRFRFIEPAEFGIRISETDDAESYSEIRMHLEGGGWKLAGLVLPRSTIRNLAATLPAK
jgi:hypothetical protein